MSGLLRLLLICRIVRRSPAGAVSCYSTYRDGGSRGIAIKHDVGDFKGKLVTHLELEAIPSVRRSRLLLLLRLSALR